MIPILPVVVIALIAGAAIGAVGSLAYTIPQHKDGQKPEPERLSSDNEKL